MKKPRLICLPHAGASSMMYSSWKKELLDVADLQLIELAGRGSRSDEPFYKNIQEAVQDIAQAMQQDLDKQPYLLFGNSMGSLLAYELCHYFESANMPLPEHLFLSAKGAPQLKDSENPIHVLPEEEFKSKVFALGGIPEDLLTNKEFGDVFWPVMRADYRLVETYRGRPKRKLNISTSILYGAADPIPMEQLLAWQDNFVLPCEFTQFEGGHLFIQEQKGRVIPWIRNKIRDTNTLKVGGESIVSHSL